MLCNHGAAITIPVDPNEPEITFDLPEEAMQIFQNEEFGSVRTLTIDNKPWFVAVDICRALDIGNPTQALTRMDEDEKMTLYSNEGHLLNVVNEAGLYTLILSSRKPEARRFKRWITHEVLPSIYKYGMYATKSTLEQVNRCKNL